MAQIASSSVVKRAFEALQRGAWGEAEAICLDILHERPNDAQALFVAGNARAYAGDTAGAQPFLERARDAAPHDVAILNSLGGVYGANGRARDAQAVLERAIEIDPRFAWARQNLANVFLEAGDLGAARTQLEEALRSNPDFPEAVSGLAEIAEREHRLDDAERLADRALRMSPGQASARILRAKLALRRGEHRGAAEALHVIAADLSLRPKNRAIAFTLLGQALEGMGDFERAFAAFGTANDLQRAMFVRQFGGDTSAMSLPALGRLAAFVREADVAQWRTTAAPGERDPVFFIGFPRSGTTLIEQILASHPDIDVAEEEEALSTLHQPLLLADGAFERWSRSSEGDIAAYRGEYWRRMQTGGRPSRPVFVDKMPLNTAVLPLIHRLFPRAKILFAVRDPRDVVISCFRQNFAVNAAMFHFLSLEGTVRFYDAVMNVAAISRARLALDIYDVRYEALVDDFDGTVRGILDFLALPWRDAVRDFAATARRRRIRTPSALSVLEPISGSAIGRWRAYGDRLEPYMPVLQRWIDAYGYGGGPAGSVTSSSSQSSAASSA